MKLRCTCGKWHELSPTALCIVVNAFAEGDMQRVDVKGIRPLCYREAFTAPSMADMAKTLNAKQSITFDADTWSLAKKGWNDNGTAPAR